MTKGSRIAAVEIEAPAEAAEDALVLTAEVQEQGSEDWWEDAPARPRRWPFLLAGLVTATAVAGWTALLVIANLAAMQAGADLAQWTGWIRDWSVPVLLLAMVWMLLMRSSRREAMRFGEAARMLGDESARLETRLSTVNRELSLAREFIAAQARDIDSLGRVSGERLSQHADKLASLIHDNGTRIDAIADVSTAALENMERLRNQLPVIASSAKDVTNNIGAAGRTAQGQIGELVAGFNKLNQFGMASEKQIMSLRDAVDGAITEFTLQTDQLGQIAEQRFAQLTRSGEQFRGELDSHEVEALAAIRSRADALSEELNQARADLDDHEAQSLTSLRARLGSVRDESAALIRSLRDGETGALDTWKTAIGALEQDLGQAIAQVAEIDRKAMESARNRLTALDNEAAEVDNRMIERDKLFIAEIEQRRADFDIRHDEFVARLAAQMADLETAAGRHHAAQDQQLSRLSSQGEAIEQQLGAFTRDIEEAGNHGADVQAKLTGNLAELESRLTASRDALNGTDAVIAGLTDSSVRLLELIQASVTHSSKNLPDALGLGEVRLQAVEARIKLLAETASEAVGHSETLAGQAEAGQQRIAQASEQAAALQQALESDGVQQARRLDALQASLTQIRGESIALAEQTQNELSSAIEALNTAARDAVSGIETMSATAITALAAKIGTEGGAALEAAMRARAAEVIDNLEETAGRAAGASRDAAVQLRDQLSKVDELAGNLERRVAHARSRAEEQVDNDFARRVALITESLHSNAIDLARAMDHEVSDTAWAAYLKGDRGIFTRRAVRLLETPEAKAVAQLYEADRDFRDHVSRYIHDFEAMLRQLLSTRDGHALGVTLLSSDMGKLYVALAQSIERLRS
ncbi:MAG: ATPase [Novosphingobium sp.]|uniref:ATPase n=1 Tax=Novosphingobium sp. TaxID=1874826 RepID=UPI0032B9C50B